ncbi:MAG: response regulator, partial [Thermodesulfobacteriota bacterium]|nr:response regulator [Thermodesulfobacteriota bacterium]
MAEKILIVDDHPVNRYLLSGILKKAGYEILEAVNGEDAIDIALRELPDCILLDIVMPKKNGYEVCFELKRNSLAENIPIIFFSAKTSLYVRFQCWSYLLIFKRFYIFLRLKYLPSLKA